MHELVQLRETAPAARHDKVLKELSNRILREISYGSKSFKMGLPFKLNVEELDSLDAANIGTSLASDESKLYVYNFLIG